MVPPPAPARRTMDPRLQGPPNGLGNEYKYFTPSDINAYFHFACQLQLWKSFHERHGPGVRSRPPALKTAHMKRGYLWEKLIVERLDQRNLILRFSSTTSLREQIERDTRDHFYIIGSSFNNPDLFRDEYISRNQTPVKFGSFKPDFIEVWKRNTHGKLVIEYHVIDAKASYKGVHVSHQAQVYFYWRALKEMLPSDMFVALPTASIWLLNEDEPRPFSPPVLQPQMDAFLFSLLPNVLRLPSSQVPWHYNAVCADCSWKLECLERTQEAKTVSMIPDLSTENADFLREVIKLDSKEDLTDIEELDLVVNGKLHGLQLEFPGTAVRFRNLMGMKRGQIGHSPVLEAVKEKSPQLLGRPTFHFPHSEDYAVIVSLVVDPVSMSAKPTVLAFDICVFLDGRLNNELSTFGKSGLVTALAKIIISIRSRDSSARTQIYCFTPEEVSKINQLIVHESLTSHSDDIRVCIGAIVDIPLVLLTSIQPELLQNALFQSWSKSTKKQLEDHLACLGLETNGNSKTLQARLQSAMASKNPALRRVPKIVSVHNALKELVAMPGPGFTTLQHCAAYLLGPCNLPGDDELYASALKDSEHLAVKLRGRGMTVHRIVGRLRSMLREKFPDISRILINQAQPLSPAYVEIVQDENLRKLVFMHEYEMLLSLKELWHERVDDSWAAPIIEFKEMGSDNHNNASFTLVEGSKDIDISTDIRLYEWILARHGTNENAEILFDDLNFYNAWFPTRVPKWSEQPETILKNIAVVNPTHLNSTEVKPIITMQLYRSFKFELKRGQRFRLLRRYIDFNTPKLLRNFLEIDSASRTRKGLFLRLLENPNEVGHRPVLYETENMREEARLNNLYRELRDLGNIDAEQLVFHRSQRRVMHSILKRQVTIAWGPPGTGKTHTLALSILYLLEILYLNTSEKVMVCMTAVTNAAIEMFVSKFEFLRDRIKAIPDLETSWLDELRIVRLAAGTRSEMPKTRLTLAAGTVWQLWNWNENTKASADVVVIDEAGQMNVGTAALALRWLQDDGRIILAGDHLQLAPILKGTYPKSDYALFGSILHCLLRDSNVLSPSIATPDTATPSEIFFQLEENFRLNPQLCNFVELIYQKRFQPMQSRREIALLGECISGHLTTSPTCSVSAFLQGMSEVMKAGVSEMMIPPISSVNSKRKVNATTLFIMKLDANVRHFSPAELHVRLEAKVVGELVRELAGAYTEETIFVVTPHRVQKALISKELTLHGLALRTKDRDSEEEPRIWVDTTERMQGSEADIVVCVFSHTHIPSLRRDLDFLYNRPRLNVAISRAKTISIVISSEGVLNPPVEALVEQGNLEGFAYLKAYEERAWSRTQLVEVSKKSVTDEVEADGRATFSSQEYEDRAWESNVVAKLKENPHPSQGTEGSSQYEDEELISLMQNVQV